MERIADCEPVFIVGMQRSGTTLLRSVLSSHPSLTIAPETHFLTSFVDHGANADPMDMAGFLEFWSKFSASTRFLDLGLDESGIRQAIIDGEDLSYRNVFGNVLNAYARKMGKPRWGEKTPSHLRYIHVLLQWFPGARVIYLVRDPRAVAGSLVQVPWRNSSAGNRGLRKLEPKPVRRLRRVFHDASTWQSDLERYLVPWATDPRVKVVRYEDLTQRPEQTARAVCTFLNETFDTGMIGSRSWSDVPPPGAQVFDGKFESWRREHLEKTLQPVHSHSVEKWRSELSALEVGVIESVCKRGMRLMGYDPAHLDDSYFYRWRSSVAARLCRTFWRVRLFWTRSSISGMLG